MQDKLVGAGMAPQNRRAIHSPNREHRIDYSGGCNTHGSYNLSLPKGKHISYKACVNVQHRFDRCSGEADDIT